MKKLITRLRALIVTACVLSIVSSDVRATGPWESVESYHLTARFKSSSAPPGITDPNSYTNDLSVGFFMYMVLDYDAVTGYHTRTVTMTNPPTSVDIILGCNESIYVWAQYPNFMAYVETNSWPAFTLEFYGNFINGGGSFSVTNALMTPTPSDVGLLWTGMVYPTSGGNIIDDLISTWGPAIPSPTGGFNVDEWIENDAIGKPNGYNPVPHSDNGSMLVGSIGHSYATVEMLASDSLGQAFVPVATNTTDVTGFTYFETTNSSPARFFKVRQLGAQSGGSTNAP